jgi:hypothetical protein
MADDYGYFGTGDAGYNQYIAASGEDKDPKGGGGGGGPNKGGRPKIGCFTILAIIFVLAAIGTLFD